MSHDDFAFEPVRGLPQTLPAGERLIWQGSPDWRGVAQRVFHARKIGLYFVLLALWQLGMRLTGQETWTAAVMGMLESLLLGCVALAILTGLAWQTARTTVYTITSRRVVMRFGIALPMTINVPYCTIESAALKLNADGTGEISLALAPDYRFAYLILWPHVRPWRFGRTQPTFRALPAAASVAVTLSRALAADSHGAVPALQPGPVADAPQPRATAAVLA